MKSEDIRYILSNASVPEHSVEFMWAMSGGAPFLGGDYLFINAADWLLAIGYPLESSYRPDEFDAALRAAVRRIGAQNCWAICPALPSRLRPHIRDRDVYYIRPSASPIPARLDRLAERASLTVTVSTGVEFTSAHRRLWAEFTARRALPGNVQELFARTEHVLSKAPGLSLLNAWDAAGHLAACLLLDHAPHRFTSYLLGAHSRIHYTPYASDLLFREMILAARRSGKEFLHLGLGVNDGIRRFKTKWGATPGPAYEYAEWCEPAGIGRELAHMARTLAAVPREPLSRPRSTAAFPRQRSFRMLWEVEKGGRKSWIGGTAHFFCFSFASSFRRLFKHVDTVVFEGPLDPSSLAQISEFGQHPEPGAPCLIDILSDEEIRCLERVVHGPRGFWARLLNCEWTDGPDVRNLLSETRPWMAFFSLWTSYLARHGWSGSVDLEAWQIAQEMGKAVRLLESLQEQIETLENIPIPRIAGFLRDCRSWGRYIRRNVRAYLKADLDGMFGTTVEFPTRTEAVIQRRDARFLHRMKPFIEAGSAAVFVGSAHMINLPGMLADAGFRVRRCR